jgi:hypothetical protein
MRVLLSVSENIYPMVCKVFCTARVLDGSTFQLKSVYCIDTDSDARSELVEWEVRLVPALLAGGLPVEGEEQSTMRSGACYFDRPFHKYSAGL